MYITHYQLFDFDLDDSMRKLKEKEIHVLCYVIHYVFEMINNTSQL